MGFQPFGYKFEIASPSRVTEAKAVIRGRAKNWFDPENGARGWICGPFICLWHRAFDGHGPMLFGLIRRDGFGTRINGRAGSDLNGLLLLALVLPFLIALFVHMLMAGNYERDDAVKIGGIILLSILCFWWAHQDRRDAEPLVRFLRDALTGTGRSLRAASEKVAISAGMTLNVSGQRAGGPASASAIHVGLLGLGEGDSMVLEAAPEHYIQTMSRSGSFIIEIRRQPGQNFQGVRRNLPNTAFERFHFTFEETLAAFLAFGSGAADPPIIDWLPMALVD